MNGGFKMLDKMKQLARNYQRIKPKDLVGWVNFKVDEKECCLELLPDNAVVYAGLREDALFTFVMNNDTFQNLLDGVWSGLTAAGRARMSDPTPLGIQFGQDVQFAGQTMQLLYHLGTHFFCKSYPTVTHFGLEHTRVVHGGNVTVLAYGHGMRSAYYTITGDQQINSDEKDPWNQCFTVIGGRGTACIDGVELKLSRGVAVHVPPFVKHTFCAAENERLELIWIAYGNQA